MKASDELRYTIYFENVITATAPAQEVVVFDDLDADLDWSTFRPSEFAFGTTVVPVAAQSSGYSTTVIIPDYREAVDQNWVVSILSQLNSQTGRVTWTFRTLDPQTNQLPGDALAGFLPPNDSKGRGEGHVSFSIRPKSDRADGTLLTNKATITFDTETSITTNEVRNVIGTVCDWHCSCGKCAEGLLASRCETMRHRPKTPNWVQVANCWRLFTND